MTRTPAIGCALLAWVAVGSACQSTQPRHPPPEIVEYASWKTMMTDFMEPAYEDVLSSEADDHANDMDFAAIAAYSRVAARQIALGYGKFELTEVDGFAELAREAERRFVEIAREADQRNSDRTRELIGDTWDRYCVRCHELVE